MSEPIRLDQLLETMNRSGGSALHLLADREPCLRLHGRLVRSEGSAVPRGALWRLVGELFNEDQRARLAQGEEVRGVYTTPLGESFCSTVMLGAGGPSLVFRRMAEQAPTLDELSLPDVVASFVDLRRGLVLVTGFMGAGKTSTIAALLHGINQTRAEHVVTVEQPVEHVHTSISGIVHQREVGRHVPSFADGVREATRLGADVIMVSDISDEATWDAVFAATERGCLVLGGCQNTSVVGLLEEVGALGHRTLFRLATSLRVLMSQTLLQRNQGADRDRVPLLEILINNDGVRRAIRDRRFAELPAIMERSSGLGMQTVDHGLKDLLSREEITSDEALYHALDRDGLFRRG